ncbi:Alpha/beta-Hydrolases superfamily protein [Hirschfeldia incana]|nr:Alpha/beta-Hydrolases superfamily protein [Hirschfeldia incana]
MSSSNFTMESCKVDTEEGVKLHTRVFKPRDAAYDDDGYKKLVIVLVHPFSLMGGCQALLKGITSELASKGFWSVTFDTRGAGKSTGRATLTGFAEVKDVIAVCRWLVQEFEVERILLVGSSAGAPIAGSAVEQVEQVVGYVSLGYPFGLLASVLFGRHHKAILSSPKPKLFVMGTKDGFTSVSQLKKKLKSAAGRTETHLVEGVSHFQMEGPEYDSLMADVICNFISSM